MEVSSDDEWARRTAPSGVNRNLPSLPRARAPRAERLLQVEEALLLREPPYLASAARAEEGLGVAARHPVLLALGKR